MPRIAGVRDDDTVYCEACGVVHGSATELVRELREQIEVLKNELTLKAVQNSRLRGMQARRVEAHPDYSKAVSILEFWQSTCSPRSKAITEDRAKLVLERLREFSQEELEQCVIGYAKKPYVVKYERSPVGKPSERFAKAETIFQDAKHVEKGIEMAEEAEDAMTVPDRILQRLPWHRVWVANRNVILRALRKTYGDLEEDGMGNLISPCPICEQGIAPLTIYDSAAGGQIARCHSCGATETKLLERLNQRKGNGIRNPEKH